MNYALPGVSVDDTAKVIAIEPESLASEALDWVTEQYTTVSRSVTAQFLFTVSRFVTRYKLVEKSREKANNNSSLQYLREKLGEKTFSQFSERLVELDELVPLLRDK